MSRKTTNANLSIIYPNATHYAFTPAIVCIEHHSAAMRDIKSYELEIYGWNNTGTAVALALHEESREVHDGRCVFDVSRYLQIAFGDVTRLTTDYSSVFTLSPLATYVGIDIFATNHAGISGMYVDELGIDALWGVGAPRASSGGTINRCWFKNFPFTVDIFAKKGTAIEVWADGEESADTITYGGKNSIYETQYNKLLLNPCEIWDAWGAEKTMHITMIDSIVLCDDIETIESVTYTLTIDHSTAGKYLRWVDSQGRLCYYLFKELGATSATSVASAWNRNSMTTPTAYIDGTNIENSTCRTFETKYTTSLGAKLVDSETFDFLLGATHSPIIEVFDGYEGYEEYKMTKWHRISVTAGSYTKTTKSLQDFTMTIEEPSRATQIL